MTPSIKTLQGSLVAIITPFKSNGAIDYAAFENLLKFHLNSGTNGIVVCGTTGETPTLTEDEYQTLIEFTVNKVNRRIPVIAGAGTNSTAKSLHYSQVAQSQGVDGLLIVGPYYNKPTAQGFYQHYSYLANRVNLPIIIYNVPGRTGKNIPPGVVLDLAKNHANIVGVKEASGDIAQIMDIIARRPKGFKVFSGDDAIAFLVVALGGDGCISVVANQIPKEFSRLMQLTLAGDIAKARQLQFKYLKLMNLNFIESNPIPVKTALSLMGMVKENFRLPMCRMEAKNKKILRQELKNLGLIK